MRSHGAAIGWQIQRQHRWGLIAIACYLIALSALRLLVSRQAVALDDPQTFAFAVIVPLSSTFMYLLAVFTFGITGDLIARESMYPARVFTLPVTSSALAGWPMLYGTATMAILWFATRLLAIWPADFEVPFIWPAVLAAAILAWMQALTWMPYPLRGMRVVVAVLVVVMIDVIVIPALHYNASELLMLAIVTPNLPFAYLTARHAVTQARRGEVPGWWSGEFFTSRGRIVDVIPERRDRFRSPAAAQAWFEWRLHGRSLPVLTGILLPFELSFLFFFHETPAIVFETLVAVLLTPLFMAVFVAATFHKSNRNRSDSYGMTSFIATRPLTSTSLIAAKLKVTIWSTAVTWLMVLVFIPIALRLSGTLPLVVDWANDLVQVVGKPHAIAFALIGFSALVASTWKQLLLSLCIALSGREWVVKGSVFLAVSFLAVIVPVAQWIISNNRLAATLWNALPWIIAVLVCLKIFTAIWIAIRLYDRRLLRERTLILGAAGWTVTVFLIYAMFVWLVSTLLIPSYFLALVAILAVPLARLSAAPLALAWNRSR